MFHALIWPLVAVALFTAIGVEAYIYTERRSVNRTIKRIEARRRPFRPISHVHLLEQDTTLAELKVAPTVHQSIEPYGWDYGERA